MCQFTLVMLVTDFTDISNITDITTVWNSIKASGYVSVYTGHACYRLYGYFKYYRHYDCMELNQGIWLCVSLHWSCLLQTLRIFQILQTLRLYGTQSRHLAMCQFTLVMLVTDFTDISNITDITTVWNSIKASGYVSVYTGHACYRLYGYFKYYRHYDCLELNQGIWPSVS